MVLLAHSSGQLALSLMHHQAWGHFNNTQVLTVMLPLRCPAKKKKCPVRLVLVAMAECLQSGTHTQRLFAVKHNHSLPHAGL